MFLIKITGHSTAVLLGDSGSVINYCLYLGVADVGLIETYTNMVTRGFGYFIRCQPFNVDQDVDMEHSLRLI
jgi:hypothetical protein